jgi:hypothetical protein
MKAPATDPGFLRLRLPSLVGLKSCLEAKDWPELARTLDLPSVWAFDRPLPVAAAVSLLGELFAGAEDLKLLVTAVRHWETRDDEIRASFVSCLMWGEAGTWAEHEFEFDLHLGSRTRADGEWRVSYLGLTAPEPSR